MINANQPQGNLSRVAEIKKAEIIILPLNTHTTV